MKGLVAVAVFVGVGVPAARHPSGGTAPTVPRAE